MYILQLFIFTENIIRLTPQYSFVELGSDSWFGIILDLGPSWYNIQTL